MTILAPQTLLRPYHYYTAPRDVDRTNEHTDRQTSVTHITATQQHNNNTRPRLLVGGPTSGDLKSPTNVRHPSPRRHHKTKQARRREDTVLDTVYVCERYACTHTVADHRYDPTAVVVVGW